MLSQKTTSAQRWTRLSPKLDPHAKAPLRLRAVFKQHQRTRGLAFDADDSKLDVSLASASNPGSKLRRHGEYDGDALAKTYRNFEPRMTTAVCTRRPIWEACEVPGLYIIPALLPPLIQTTLLDRLLHRDLSNPSYNTNVHLHHHIPYPPAHASFFTTSPTPTTSDPPFPPKNPLTHNPITLPTFLGKKLRWLTLGAQYDWTTKTYPRTPAPPFPADVASLIQSLFPSVKADAAIVNVYSPGDTLSPHRDVSEACDDGLVSISLGCDAVFVLGLGERADGDAGGGDCGGVLTLRLRSGDALFMTGAARFAWHGVPAVLAGTCPEYLADWPAAAGREGDGGEYEGWRGWMRGKRVNLNVRQMTKR